MAQFDSTKIRTIGVFSSGGDAPGMNAAIRATTRMALQKGWNVKGIIGGYSGFLNEDYVTLTSKEMGNILQRGGTILKTGRCLEFLQADVRARAIGNVRKAGIDAIVCVGGDGSFTGCELLWKEHQYPMVGVPGTIDNDIFGTDFTIGFDTAVNTALEAIDRIRDTATSHDRVFIVEVMGHNSSFIAADVGLAGGAEDIFYSEGAVSLDQVVERIKKGLARGKRSSILVTAEGQKPGRAYDLAEALRKRAGFEAKVCVLGHIQRGGSPTASDRILASRMGAGAVEVLAQGQCDMMVGVQNGEVVTVPFHDAISHKKKVALGRAQLARSLA